MGMLHKLVYIIDKLDPDNARWMQLQIDAAATIPDVSARDAALEAIERDFADNKDDYGRKLYLIENCLYGVDIQPIAARTAGAGSTVFESCSTVCDTSCGRATSGVLCRMIFRRGPLCTSRCGAGWKLVCSRFW